MHINPTVLGDLRHDRIQLTGPPVLVEHRDVVFPGAFNPLHDGHRRMAIIAGKQLSAEVDFELSICNVDKPEISPEEVARRAGQFEPSTADPSNPSNSGHILWMTRAAAFAEKAAIFPGCTFVIGADTAMRLANLWYYNGDLAGRDAALGELQRHGCRFLVFGRLVKDAYCGIESMDLPADWRALCDGVTEATFRMDISSTELRRRDQA